MDRVPVESTALTSVGYRGSTLEIEFVTGRVYQYFDVPADIHHALMQAESKGAFFNEQIRESYRFAAR